MPGRILVVDDVATNRIILKVKLAAACYEVLQAEGGAEALDVARSEQPDVILLDMAMPDIPGLEVCRRLKADPATAAIPVIMITAYNDTGAKIDALQAGAEEFLSKPLDDMGLLARVRSLLRAKDIAEELSLREGTCQALGFAEEHGTFAEQGRIALVASDLQTGLAWRNALEGRVHDRIDVLDRADALRQADRDTAHDLYVVSASLDGAGDGLMLLSELRANAATRHAAILMVLPRNARGPASMALDLGASDLLSMPLDPEELALRIKTQMSRKKQSDKLRRRVQDGLQLAVTDPLTGLYNRRYAMSHLARVTERAEETGRPFAAMIVDLDRFKRVNDRFGHAAGDRVLRTVAERLSANLRSVDLIARIGGEEFLVVMPEIETEAACRAAERLCRAVQASPVLVNPESKQERAASVLQTVSIGLAMGGSDPSDPARRAADPVADLLERADRALYIAKSSGRNMVTMERTAA